MSFDPVSIAARISKTKDVCRKCGTVFSWEEGFLCADKLEIKATIVACPKCHSVYIPNIVSGSMSLGNDVTDQYPQAKQNKVATPDQSAIKKDEKQGRTAKIGLIILGVACFIILICCLCMTFIYFI
jgi:hypothetical protein